MQGTEYSFGPFRFHDGRGELLRDGSFLEVGSRALQLLGVLLKRNGGLVTKEELFEILWPNIIVEEGNLSTQVWTLRKALSDLQRPNRLIDITQFRGFGRRAC